MRYCASLFAIVVFALTVGLARAQITLTEADMPQVGNSFAEHWVSDVDVNIGSAGENQTWTILDYGGWTGDTLLFVAPGTTPFTALFPTATICATGVDQQGFQYIRVASDGVFFLGSASYEGADTLIIQYTPETLYVLLPLTYSSDSWTRVMRWTVPAGPSDSIVFVDSVLCDVDGWGTLITPFDTMSALRTLNHIYNITTMPDSAPQIEERYAYEWLSEHPPAGAYMQSSQDPPSPNFTHGNVSVTTLLSLDAPEPPRGPVAEHFTMGQNYPNPFNASTTLPLELDRYARVTLSIYDELGRLVSQRLLELPPGSYVLPIDGGKWSSGTYFARVSANNYSETAKMQLIK